MSDPVQVGLVVDPFRAPELGNSTFLVADPDAGEGVVIDPLRDVGQYISRSEELGVEIRYALETHVHNDFVSGSRELEAEVGARVGAAATAGLEFPFVPLVDGQEVRVGRFRLKVISTPGHTPEHVSYLAIGEDGCPLAIFTGGALMVGSIARTDLFGSHQAARLALEAYRTLHVRLRALPDDVVVYPTHGSGSFCAASESESSSTTMGRERKSNPYLTTTELAPFIARALALGPYPAYYREMASINRKGARLIGQTLPKLSNLSADQVDEYRRRGAALVDVRAGREYDRGHIPGSFNVGLKGSFSAWVGWVIERERPIILVGGRGAEHAEAHRQLLRIGYDSVVGQLDGGLDAWVTSGRSLSSFETADVSALAKWILSGEQITVVDVRNEDEWAQSHLPGAIRMSVWDVPQRAREISAEAPVAVHCSMGYRAAIAASLLEQAGFQRIVHVVGSYMSWDRLNPIG